VKSKLLALAAGFLSVVTPATLARADTFQFSALNATFYSPPASPFQRLSVLRSSQWHGNLQ
jgi:hypothetical protein